MTLSTTPAFVHPTTSAHFRPRLRVIYAIEAMCEVSVVLATIGIYFLTTHRYGWGLRANFLLAMTQGVAGVSGAMLTGIGTRRIGRLRTLAVLCALLAIVSAAPLLLPGGLSQAVVVPVVLLYTALGTACWPAIESLVVTGTDPRDMSRRIGGFNFVWASASAFALAISGALIDFWPSAVFLIALLCDIACALLIVFCPSVRVGSPASDHLEPEPQLLAQRKLAMYLSRIAMPAVMVVISSLLAMLPLLPVLRELDTSVKTLVSSIWMAARWLAFVGLGASVWWHTRPKILLAAIVLLLAAFLCVTLRPSDWLGVSLPWTLELTLMILGQIGLGLAAGMVYVASLYFGLVLTHGSTEQGGYHEALIAFGTIVGPAAGAGAQWYRPGDVTAGVAAVAGIIVVTLLIALVVSLRFSAATVSARQRGGFGVLPPHNADAP